MNDERADELPASEDPEVSHSTFPLTFPAVFPPRDRREPPAEPDSQTEVSRDGL